MLTMLIVITTFTHTFAQNNAKLNGSGAHSNVGISPIFTDRIPQNNRKTISISHLEIPKTRPNDIITRHLGYSLLYDELHEQAKWVAYELTSAETHKVASRTNKFLPDPQVKTNTANSSDYLRSGYDKGHLAPAGDMSWSSTAMAESFYYSNISPQVPAFNRGIWKRLEALVRMWAIENNAVYVVTGPVLTNGLPTIGPDKVSVSKYFYKVILDYTGPDCNGIGFIMPNARSEYPLQNYAVTIDSVEKITGIDFFSALPDMQEKLIEKSLCIPCWSWRSSKTSNTKTVAFHKTSASDQCKGTTKAGNRCKKRALTRSGYCYLHDKK